MKLYRAVVEDNNNPKFNGKVRVRIFGLHTPDLEFVKTEDLPWAEIIQPVGFAGSGIGTTEIPKNGTWVFVTLDHNDPNRPIIIGGIAGTSALAADTSVGFNDPDGIMPLEDRLEEPDVNRLARQEKLDETIHQTIIDTKDEPTAEDSITGANVDQVEPDSLNDLSAYPNVKVLETPSGHVIELDDTETNERIRVYHTSGSYIEIRPDGSFIQKSVGTEISHYIHAADVHEHIVGEVKRYIELNIEEIVNGYVKRNVKKIVHEHLEGGVKETNELDFENLTKGFFQITAEGNLEIVADLKVTGSVECTGDIVARGSLRADGDVTDGLGDLDVLRTTYDTHITAEYNTHLHTGNLGAPTSPPLAPGTEDAPVQWGDFTWSSSPLGFVE